MVEDITNNVQEPLGLAGSRSAGQQTRGVWAIFLRSTALMKDELLPWSRSAAVTPHRGVVEENSIMSAMHAGESAESQALAHYKGTKHAKKLKALDSPKTKLKGSLVLKDTTMQELVQGITTSQVSSNTDSKGPELDDLTSCSWPVAAAAAAAADSLSYITVVETCLPGQWDAGGTSCRAHTCPGDSDGNSAPSLWTW
ncbi:unnamed protein product [Pleuronectes platessa]|uniref:Uncharacterized protein n=1 Tax=Pleuronectes platessa TaxID=8262 RepID=A0A9N7UXX1_PLEPL|nr:unnamed protein product [Pleuronectes platessa]